MAARSSGGEGSDNPFRAALRPAEEDNDRSRTRPFGRSPRESNPTKADQLRTVAELDLVDRVALERAPKVRDLTVRDLNDLAAEFSGIPTNNPAVAELTIEDLQDLEGIFLEFKLQAGREIGRFDADQLVNVDVSCCCCTPCCCCAATDMSHTG